MNANTELEKEFLQAVDKAAARWNHSIEDSHLDGTYGVDVTFEREDWGYCADEMLNALNSVFDIFDGEMDTDGNIYRLALH